MGKKSGVQLFDERKDGVLSICGLGTQWNDQDDILSNQFQLGALFASIGQMGMNVGVTPNPPTTNPHDGNKSQFSSDVYEKYVPPTKESSTTTRVVELPGGKMVLKNPKKKKNGAVKLKIKVANPSLRRLISGAIAGAVSRTAVAPLETIRTHLMVGSSGHSTTEVFNNIMKSEGWKGLFRGNLINVIRVAPSKAIELFAFDTVNKKLSPKPGEKSKIPLPPSLVAGACAGVSSTLLTYPLELVKTRITIQKDVYKGILDAFVTIAREEGPTELYRGLFPSLIGVVPYAAANYYAYDTFRKLYKKVFKQEKIGNVETLLIGSLAGALSSSATFPLEVARKRMQVGAVNGRQVYNGMFHALACILEQEGVSGLFKGLGPSCMKLVPAAGISFMCYEACKRILVEIEVEEEA